MNNLKLLFPLLLLVFIGCSTPTSKNPTKDSLLVAVNTFNDAFSTGDITTLTSMIASDYKHSNGNSKAIGAKSWLNYIEKRNKDLANGNLIVNNYDMDQIEVVLYDRSAIVTGRVKTASTYKGERRDNEFRVSHFWIYENGQWKRAGFHDGKIK